MLQRILGIYTIVTIASIDAFSYASIHPRSVSMPRFANTKTRNLYGRYDKTKLCAFEPFQTTAGAIGAFYETWPLFAGALTCGAKASAADFVAQLNTASNNKVEMIPVTTSKSMSTLAATRAGVSSRSRFDFENSFRFEVPRNVAFIVYGVLYQGIFQHFLYNMWFPRWFGDNSNLHTVTIKVIFDSLVIVPTLCWPIAYCITAFVAGGDFELGMKKYFHDLKHTSLFKNFCLIWIPAKVRNTPNFFEIVSQFAIDYIFQSSLFNFSITYSIFTMDSFLIQ
jgi:hypothetical protein